MATASENLKQLGLTLPPVAQPVGAYLPCKRHGHLLHLSGQIPLQDGKLAYVGKIGDERDVAYGQAAARVCTLNAIAIAAEAAGGIDNIAGVLKAVIYVASADGFTDQHLVANGTSELLVSIFGETGKHARAAVGMAELPLNASVEVDVLFELGG